MIGTIVIRRYSSPVGSLILGAYGHRLCLCDWEGRAHRSIIDSRLCRLLNAEYRNGDDEVLKNAEVELDGYFAGLRKVFTVPLLLTGTDFQHIAWNELLKIPYGTTITYAEQARRIGNSSAVRAVAAANASNPISIFVPCHRVIGTSGKLTGYAGGIEAKRHLLRLESTGIFGL